MVYMQKICQPVLNKTPLAFANKAVLGVAYAHHHNGYTGINPITAQMYWNNEPVCYVGRMFRGYFLEENMNGRNEIDWVKLYIPQLDHTTARLNFKTSDYVFPIKDAIKNPKIFNPFYWRISYISIIRWGLIESGITHFTSPSTKKVYDVRGGSLRWSQTFNSYVQDNLWVSYSDLKEKEVPLDSFKGFKSIEKDGTIVISNDFRDNYDLCYIFVMLNLDLDRKVIVKKPEPTPNVDIQTPPEPEKPIDLFDKNILSMVSTTPPPNRGVYRRWTSSTNSLPMG